MFKYNDKSRNDRVYEYRIKKASTISSDKKEFEDIRNRWCEKCQEASIYRCKL